ncbi:MAG: metallophosphoesterase [Oscillospiraceae bacterium]|jgi:Icc-related predicted phosphoesterase|nr:metallophosphoesterase [Oscillospiraceae bacterium]
MRLLLISDEESPYLWDCYRPENLAGVELILSAGDLKTAYLEFLCTMLPVPLVYVPGNHDARFINAPPGGCTCADGALVTACGLRIAGLGGCMGTDPSQPYQYTEEAMAKRLAKLDKAARRAGGADIFLTHAPALGRGDGCDPFHKGFECFHGFIARHRPRLHVYGHQHKRYAARQKPPQPLGGTVAVNACGYKIVEI